MKVGIGLPATIPNVPSDIVLAWAKRADECNFSSLGIIDRLVYPNYEPLITLAAVSSVTKRVRLMTSILIAPLRRPGLLAKQASTLDRISAGRLTLGLAIGGREDDFRAAPASFKTRARRFEEQLRIMKTAWSGQSVAENLGAIGPRPVQTGGPEILIGGYSPPAITRVGRWADGYIASGSDPARAASMYKLAEDSWKAAGRQGKPRLVCATYFALGEKAVDRGGAYLRDYYKFLGPAAENLARGMLSTPDAVKGAINSFSETGADELIFWPCVPDLEQVDLLAQLLP